MIDQHYTDPDNVYEDLAVARRAMTDPSTSSAQWDQLQKTLGLMFLYCPEDLQPLVESQLREAEIRRAHREGVIT